MRTLSVIGDFSKATPARTVRRSFHIYSAPAEKNQPSSYWNGRVTASGGPDTVEVPIRLQFDHSTVPSKVHCGPMRWRRPNETTSGRSIVVLAVEARVKPPPPALKFPLIF